MRPSDVSPQRDPQLAEQPLRAGCSQDRGQGDARGRRSACSSRTILLSVLVGVTVILLSVLVGVTVILLTVLVGVTVILLTVPLGVTVMPGGLGRVPCVTMAMADFVLRPFEGLPGEPDWVAMRELVPAATATARTTAAYGYREVLVATVLPLAWPAQHRGDGVVAIALQQNAGSGDASRDLAALLLKALDLEPGTPVRSAPLPEPGPRLQEVLDLTVPFEVTVHDSFDFWDSPGTDLPAEAVAMRETLDVVPTRRLASVESAYWTRMSGREFLRWAQPGEEDVFMDALARLHAERRSGLGDDGALGRFLGAFRSCGLVVPVWALEGSAPEDVLEAEALALRGRLDKSLAVDGPLDAKERRARSGLVARQLTLR